MVQKQYNEIKTVKPTKAMEKWRKETEPYTIIGIHNHPNNAVPSYSDFKTAYKRKYKYGVAVGHYGSIFRYYVNELPEEGITNIMLDELQNALYNDNHTEINRIKNNLEYLGIKIEVLK